jgi:hypothetical protein
MWLTKENGAKTFAIIYLIAFFAYPTLILIDINKPIEKETFDLLGKFLFYAGGGFFAIIGLGNISLLNNFIKK